MLFYKSKIYIYNWEVATIIMSKFSFHTSQIVKPSTDKCFHQLHFFFNPHTVKCRVEGN